MEIMNTEGETLFQDSFTQSEIRCGYYVSDSMKKVWAIELDLIRKFVEVCEAPACAEGRCG